MLVYDVLIVGIVRKVMDFVRIVLQIVQFVYIALCCDIFSAV